jgi:hypothetical protein
MSAHRERHWQLLAARHATGVDALKVGWGSDVRARFVAVAQTQSPAADIPASGRRIDRVINRGAQIARAVEGVLGMERQLGEIDVLAGDLDLMHGRVSGRYFDKRLWAREPLEIFIVELVFARFERRGKTPAITGGLSDQLDVFRSGLLEQDGLVRALDDRT